MQQQNKKAFQSNTNRPFRRQTYELHTEQVGGGSLYAEVQVEQV